MIFKFEITELEMKKNHFQDRGLFTSTQLYLFIPEER